MDDFAKYVIVGAIAIFLLIGAAMFLEHQGKLERIITCRETGRLCETIK